jgi:hypothetical protein
MLRKKIDLTLFYWDFEAFNLISKRVCVLLFWKGKSRCYKEIASKASRIDKRNTFRAQSGLYFIFFFISLNILYK